jgi:hypothetical protein
MTAATGEVLAGMAAREARETAKEVEKTAKHWCYLQ